MRNPTHGARDSKDWREHRYGDANGAHDETRIEIDVRIEFALDEIGVLKRDALKLHGNLQHGVITLAVGVEHLVAVPLQHLCARVVTLIDAMAEAHEPIRVMLILGALDDLGNAINRADRIECGEDALVGATMQ